MLRKMSMYVKNKETLQRYKESILQYFSPYKNWKFSFFVILGYVYLFINYQIAHEAGILATRYSGPEIDDALFALLPRINTSFIHADLSFALYYFRNLILLFFPDRIIFALFTLGTLILTRSFFINLTHLGMPHEAAPIVANGTFGGDLFFSGHVAYPFLLALIFWDKKILRYFFLASALIFGIAAIVGRYHYSIDVFVAPFIAYGIFAVSKKFFHYRNSK